MCVCESRLLRRETINMLVSSSSVPCFIDRRIPRRCVKTQLGWSSVVLGARRRRHLRSRELALVGDTVSCLLIVGAVWAIYTTTGALIRYEIY